MRLCLHAACTKDAFPGIVEIGAEIRALDHAISLTVQTITHIDPNGPFLFSACRVLP